MRILLAVGVDGLVLLITLSWIGSITIRAWMEGAHHG